MVGQYWNESHKKKEEDANCTSNSVWRRTVTGFCDHGSEPSWLAEKLSVIQEGVNTVEMRDIRINNSDMITDSGHSLLQYATAIVLLTIKSF